MHSTASLLGPRAGSDQSPTSWLSVTGRQTWTQNSTGVIGTAEAGDNFGAALATGDFTGSGRTDLAVGVPFETVSGVSQAGFVNVLYSAGSTGLSSTSNQGWSENATGLAGPSARFARFGASVTAGDLNGDGADALAVGAPVEAVSGVNDAGAVTVISGGGSGLTAAGSSFWEQATSGIAGTPQGLDEFGISVAALPITSASRDDLLIGVSGDTVSGSQEAGSMEFIPSSASGPTATGSKAWNTATAGIKGLTIVALFVSESQLSS